jgi:bidirectional [NiFe] hydrogenase diaphorase subunit
MKIKLNGKSAEAARGETVLTVARREGIDVPALCHHHGLMPYGSCRICIVEIREKRSKKWKVVASCLYPVSDGLEVKTDTEKIIKHRRMLIELMLARCGNVPYIKQLAKEYGVRKGRLAESDKDCILCGLCVRVCNEVVGRRAIGFVSRGINREVGIPFGADRSACIACGACTYVCPTGAIQMEYQRREELREGGGEHLCRYSLMGLVSESVCTQNYECERCEIDQKMMDRFGTHPMLSEEARVAMREGGVDKERIKSSGGKGKDWA